MRGSNVANVTQPASAPQATPAVNLGAVLEHIENQVSALEDITYDLFAKLVGGGPGAAASGKDMPSSRLDRARLINERLSSVLNGLNIVNGAL